MEMTNIERLKMEIKGIDFTDTELEIYLTENDLVPSGNYVPTSTASKKNILKTALSILESVANQPQLMKNYRTEDMTISQFSENLQVRIDSLDRKIRMIKNDDNTYTDGASFIYMFNN